jgi:hypothetical protein
MQERTLYEYAVLRLVPRVEREEFINIGVILFCKKQKFAGVKYLLDEDKLNAIFKNDEMCITTIKQNLQSFEQICIGDSKAGKIARLPVAERFRWLTAKRSTIIQTSAVHSGRTFDAAQTLGKLFEELVL